MCSKCPAFLTVFLFFNIEAVPLLDPACGREDCGFRGSCVGSRLKPVCVCDLGYSGVRCQEAPCDSITACHGNGICVGTTHRSSCLCNVGRTGDRCQYATATSTYATQLRSTSCTPEDCNNNGVCVGSRTSPVCLCNLGYIGLRCEIEPPCISAIQCLNNGLCIGGQKTFTCLCNIGWSGPNCQFFYGK